MTYLDYLKNRNISRETIEEFSISYRDEKGFYYTYYDFPKDFLKQLDDKFKDAILFPVADLYGNFIGVVARSLKKGLKFINSNFRKSYYVFGINKTYKDILENKEVYVVEGIFDFFSLYQNGIRNVVSLQGSSLSTRQACLLSRFAERIIIVPDGDEGGRSLKKQSEEVLKKYGIKYEFIILPEGKDPDDFIKDFGINSFLDLRKEVL
jgi:DNA primase